jgi:hypothetical protein
MTIGESQTTFGTPGTYVSPGQYALDWITFLGGTATTPDGIQLRLTMPIQAGIPVQWPQELQCLIANWRLSLVAAIQGKVYPPGSDQPPPYGCGLWYVPGIFSGPPTG